MICRRRGSLPNARTHIRDLGILDARIQIPELSLITNAFRRGSSVCRKIVRWYHLIEGRKE
jgi:hypothetical protein